MERTREKNREIAVTLYSLGEIHFEFGYCGWRNYERAKK
jgi:hypothetical protein